MDYLWTHPEQDCFLGSLPFLYKDLILEHSLGNLALILEWPELSVSIKIRLEMLQQDDFLIQALRVFLDRVGQDFILALSVLMHVIEVVMRRIQSDLGWVVKVDSVSSVRQLVTEAVFGTEINELHDHIARLLRSVSQFRNWDGWGISKFNLCLRRRRSRLFFSQGRQLLRLRQKVLLLRERLFPLRSWRSLRELRRLLVKLVSLSMRRIFFFSEVILRLLWVSLTILRYHVVISLHRALVPGLELGVLALMRLRILNRFQRLELRRSCVSMWQEVILAVASRSVVSWCIWSKSSEVSVDTHWRSSSSVLSFH
jgi:hypothetical protein